MTDTTFSIECPCGCGAAVSLTLGGFATTSAEVGACPTAAASGIRSYTVRKSAALGYRRAA